MHYRIFCTALALVMGFSITSAKAQDSAPKADFLFIGSYHMNNPGRDTVNTKADDVLEPKRQREIQEVVRLIERYRPTKIMLEIEAERQGEIDKRFAESCAGSRSLTRNESEQLGFRTACNLGLKTVYAIDHDALSPVQDPDSINYLKAVERHQQQAQYEALLASLKVWVDQGQQVLARGTVLDMLKDTNSDAWLHENAKTYYAIGLLGAPDDPIGANWVQYWFGRNLAIFNMIARNTESGDRILVIYGAGHGNHLRQLATDSGIYRVHQPIDWLSNTKE